MRVETNGLPSDNWHHFLRLRDLKQVVAEVAVDPSWRVLEIGAGDGVQTSALREIFDEVQPVDIAPSGLVEGLVVADVTDLPFDDDQFDLIFSSNVLEHVEDIDAGLIELRRVLAPGGIMIHSMPTGVWKVIQVVGRPMASLVKAVRMLVPGISPVRSRARAGSHGALHDTNLSKRSLLKRVVGLIVPTVHGVTGNHITEFLQFRPKWWMKKFESSGLNCFRSSPLFLHSPYDALPYRFIPLREQLSKLGIASVRVYWMKSS